MSAVDMWRYVSLAPMPDRLAGLHPRPVPPEFRPGPLRPYGLARTKSCSLPTANRQLHHYRARSFTDYLRRWLAHAGEK